MKRPSPHSATALYATAATSAVIGALLWLRSRNSSGESLFLYGSSGSGVHAPSAWRVWSSTVTEERLGMYLLGAALVLALAARLVATWRE